MGTNSQMTANVPVWAVNPYSGKPINVEPLFRMLDNRGSTLNDFSMSLDSHAFHVIEYADVQAMEDRESFRAVQDSQFTLRQLRDVFREMASAELPGPSTR